MVINSPWNTRGILLPPSAHERTWRLLNGCSQQGYTPLRNSYTLSGKSEVLKLRRRDIHAGLQLRCGYHFKQFWLNYCDLTQTSLLDRDMKIDVFSYLLSWYLLAWLAYVLALLFCCTLSSIVCFIIYDPAYCFVHLLRDQFVIKFLDFASNCPNQPAFYSQMRMLKETYFILH